MDLLVVSVEAGLGLDAAIQRVASRFRHPLGELFSKAMAEISLGSPREAAFRGIAEALPFDEIKSFTASIIQAERLEPASLRSPTQLPGCGRGAPESREHAEGPGEDPFPSVSSLSQPFRDHLGPAMIQILRT
jgi:tight adherence protein C